jgi:hypothetical protein
VAWGVVEVLVVVWTRDSVHTRARVACLCVVRT